MRDTSSADVVVVGAGPAGAVAAALLAGRGARVRLLDRASFPRDKLCGDTVNPGTRADLGRLGLAADLDHVGLPIDGMRLTSTFGAIVNGRYPEGRTGRALMRRDLDWMLVKDAVAAGARFEPGVTVRNAVLDGNGVAGVRVSCGGVERSIAAPVTIAADGRRSALTFGLGLARHAARPRRWAIGGYFEAVAPLDSAVTFGEMHVRHHFYIGVASLPGGLTNACLVTAPRGDACTFRDPTAVLLQTLASEPLLRDRFAGARLVARPAVLGPLAIDVDEASVRGLLVAGDAAGFIDPITGDGLRFAIVGGELAAAAALEALEHGWTGVHDRLHMRRRAAFGRKWRFNRFLRDLVASPRRVGTAALAARVAPTVFRQLISYAGDCARA